MSKKFFDLVQQFFSLLDVDGNGKIDIFEARSSLTICFSSLLQNGPHPKVDEVVQNQVQWLFREADENKDNEISQQEFINFYKKLLKESPLPQKKGGIVHAGIEEEVLRVDLERAIQALSKSRRASMVTQEHLHEKAKICFKMMDSNKDGVITVADCKDSLGITFASAIKTSSSVSSSSSSPFDNLFSLLTVSQTKEEKLHEAKSKEKLTEEEFVSIFKKLAQVYSQQPSGTGLTLQTLERDLDAGIKFLKQKESTASTSASASVSASASASATTNVTKT